MVEGVIYGPISYAEFKFRINAEPYMDVTAAISAVSGMREAV